MNKWEELECISQEINNCQRCKENTTGVGVAGEGNPSAKVVFVGEAPGKQEALSGRPFIGRSGKLLRKVIEDIGMSPEEVFITSPVKYLPNSGTPSASDIEHGKTHLEKQLAVIDPTCVVLMGATACKALLDSQALLHKIHGKIIQKEKRIYFITFHPAAALRFPRIRKLFMQDFAILKNLLPKM